MTATFDGTVLRPDQPLRLAPNTRVRITVESEDPASEGSFLQTASALKLEGPSDWSSRLDDYLYGSPPDGHD
jgi:hypothetical protein